MRITAGTNAWNKVEGVIDAYHVNLKEIYSEVALTEKQQEKI